MNTNTNSKILMPDSYPHPGTIVAKYFKKFSVIHSQLARKLSVTNPTVTRYVSSNINNIFPFKTLWNLSIVLNQNLIAELGESVPVEYVTVREKALRQELETLQKENEKLNMELSIYKKIMEK